MSHIKNKNQSLEIFQNKNWRVVLLTRNVPSLWAEYEISIDGQLVSFFNVPKDNSLGIKRREVATVYTLSKQKIEPNLFKWYCAICDKEVISLDDKVISSCIHFPPDDDQIPYLKPSVGNKPERCGNIRI